MFKRTMTTAVLALIAFMARHSVSAGLYAQPPGTGRGASGGRGGSGGDADRRTPNVNQFRTIDDVKYVDGEV